MKCIGITTDNSLNAIDVVLTEFNHSSITDIYAHSKDIPLTIAEKFRNLQQQLIDNNGNIEEIYQTNNDNLICLHNEYINLVAETVNELIKKTIFPNQKFLPLVFMGKLIILFSPQLPKKTMHLQFYKSAQGKCLQTLLIFPLFLIFALMI